MTAPACRRSPKSQPLGWWGSIIPLFLAENREFRQKKAAASCDGIVGKMDY